MIHLAKALRALVASERLLRWVGDHVALQHGQTNRAVVAHLTNVRPLARVRSLVNLQGIGSGKHAVAFITRKLVAFPFASVHDEGDVDKGGRFILLLLLLFLVRVAVSFLVHQLLHLVARFTIIKKIRITETIVIYDKKDWHNINTHYNQRLTAAYLQNCLALPWRKRSIDSDFEGNLEEFTHHCTGRTY